MESLIWIKVPNPSGFVASILYTGAHENQSLDCWHIKWPPQGCKLLQLKHPQPDGWRWSSRKVFGEEGRLFLYPTLFPWREICPLPRPQKKPCLACFFPDFLLMAVKECSGSDENKNGLLPREVWTLCPNDKSEGDQSTHLQVWSRTQSTSSNWMCSVDLLQISVLQFVGETESSARGFWRGWICLCGSKMRKQVCSFYNFLDSPVLHAPHHLAHLNMKLVYFFIQPLPLSKGICTDKGENPNKTKKIKAEFCGVCVYFTLQTRHHPQCHFSKATAINHSCKHWHLKPDAGLLAQLLLSGSASESLERRKVFWVFLYWEIESIY